MPDATSNIKHSKHKRDSVSDVAINSSGARIKEQEPGRSEETQVLSEIKEASKEADLEAVEKVRQEIGKEAKLSQEEIEIGSDLEDHGVRSPDKEASSVLAKGNTIDLSISEEDYRRGEHAKVSGKVVDKVVFGVSAVVALTIWIGRILKKIHSGTTGKVTKVVFRKEGE